MCEEKESHPETGRKLKFVFRSSHSIRKGGPRAKTTTPEAERAQPFITLCPLPTSTAHTTVAWLRQIASTTRARPAHLQRCERKTRRQLHCLCGAGSFGGQATRWLDSTRLDLCFWATRKWFATTSFPPPPPLSPRCLRLDVALTATDPAAV